MLQLGARPVSPSRPRVADDLLEIIELQKVGCQLTGSSLYADILDAVAVDLRGGGVSQRILGPYAAAPLGDAVLLRLLAAVHELVLRGDAPDLAAHYPSVGGTPGRRPGGPFLDAVREHEAEIASAMVRCVQTNEVGRCVPLLGGHLELGRLGLPLRVFEIGASAGLNLRFDHYRYVTATRSWGPVDSPLVFTDPFVGRAPDLDVAVQVVERRGSDPEPIDPTTESGRLRLRSYLWPDQPERRVRLDQALEVARRVPVEIERADAVSWTRSVLARPEPGTCTVLVHSIMFQYLSRPDRAELLDLIDGAGRRATPEAPLAWLRMEPGGDQAETRLALWPHGIDRIVARSPYHGPRATWSPTRAVVPAP